MTAEENNDSNELPNKEFDEKREKTLEKLIKYEKELEKKWMEELDLRRRQKEMMNRNDPGPPRLKKKYECEQKFIVNLEFVKSNFHFSMSLGTNEKISDIIEKLRQRFNINSRILFRFN